MNWSSSGLRTEGAAGGVPSAGLGSAVGIIWAIWGTAASGR